MNDYWNDPPETPEMPECPVAGCEGQADPDCGSSGNLYLLKCEECGYEWTVEREPDPEPPKIPDNEDWPTPEDILAGQSEKCHHGKEHHECDACMHESDLAYDAARERR